MLSAGCDGVSVERSARASRGEEGATQHASKCVWRGGRRRLLACRSPASATAKLPTDYPNYCVLQ